MLATSMTQHQRTELPRAAARDTNATIIDRIQSGDHSAYQDLWEQNKRFVYYFAKRHYLQVEQRNSIDFDDVVQAGYIGLHKAAGKYKSGSTAKFTTYAAHYIKNEIQSTLGICRGRHRPTDIALSLDAPLNTTDDNSCLANLLAADEQPCQWETEELYEAVRAAVTRIRGDGIRNAILAYYWFDIPKSKIAEDCGVELNSVARWIIKGLSSLRKDSALREWAADYGYRV